MLTRADITFLGRSHQVLCGNIDNVSLGMPGSALADHHLAEADMPQVEEMVADSLDACCMFKRQASVPDPPPPPPPAPPDPLADFSGILPDGEPKLEVCARMFCKNIAPTQLSLFCWVSPATVCE